MFNIEKNKKTFKELYDYLVGGIWHFRAIFYVCIL